VFYDVDSIPAGEPWREVLLRAIDNASHFYLLWCKHSARSQEIEWEWRRAISGSKRLVPVLLDSTPLIQPLTEYQWVDFRGVVKGHQDGLRRTPSMWTLALAAVPILAVIAVLWFVPLASDPSLVPSFRPSFLVALSVFAVVTLAVLMMREYRSSRRKRRATEQLAEAIAQDLATHGNGT
jgi:Flp pilus assembly protein TadB